MIHLQYDDEGATGQGKDKIEQVNNGEVDEQVDNGKVDKIYLVITCTIKEIEFEYNT